MTLSTCSNFTEIPRMHRFCIITGCPLLWMQPAYALDAGKLYPMSGDRISIAQKAYCLAGIQAPAIGQTCQRANCRNFDCGHISKTALMDLTAVAKFIVKLFKRQPLARSPSAPLTFSICPAILSIQAGRLASTISLMTFKNALKGRSTVFGKGHSAFRRFRGTPSNNLTNI